MIELIHGAAGLLFTAGAAVFFLAPESRAFRPPHPIEWPWDARFAEAPPVPTAEVPVPHSHALMLETELLRNVAPPQDADFLDGAQPATVAA